MAVRRFVDIGANLTDSMFSGLYGGSKKHETDIEDVLDRSWKQGLEKIIITGGSLSESRKALELSHKHERLYATVGCHPTRCDEFENSGDPESYLNSLADLIQEGIPKVVAVGECGLDYDRLHFCKKETQLQYFEMQLDLSKKYKLPLFIHCRNAATDLIGILNRHRDLPSGVIHSFDGTLEEAEQFLNLGYYIGINGCSLKTESNLDVAKKIPSEYLMLETDCPWCEIKPSHASSKYVTTKFQSSKKEKWQKNLMVKGRNEPSNIVQVFEVLMSIRGGDPDLLCDQIYKNSMKIFFNNCK